MSTGWRLLFLDVDGTLLTAEQKITERTLRSVERSKSKGVRVSLSTGRTFESARPYAQAIGADAPLILYNGARVQSPETGEVLHEWRLDVKLARIALDALRTWDVHVSLFHDDAIYIAEWNDRARESARKDGVTFVTTGDLGARLHAPPLKIMIIGEVEMIDRLDPQLRATYSRAGLEAPAIVRTEPNYLEIWNRGTSKGAAAAWIATRLGIPLTEAIAFGDSLNDLDLIQSTGLGVAMGNAHPALKKAARRVSPSNQDDGIAAVLEELFP